MEVVACSDGRDGGACFEKYDRHSFSVQIPDFVKMADRHDEVQILPPRRQFLN